MKLKKKESPEIPISNYIPNTLEKSRKNGCIKLSHEDIENLDRPITMRGENRNDDSASKAMPRTRGFTA